MGGKSNSQTIGYWYYMDVLATLCAGPVDELVEIQVGDRTAWTGSATTSKTISIYKRDLFGGEKREGGVEGHVDVMMGAPNMSINEYLGASLRATGITGPVSAYRGVCSLFFRGITTNAEFADSSEFTLIGSETPPLTPGTLPSIGGPAFRWVAMNPYLKKFRAKVRRYSSAWYPSKARIGNDSNPIHIIYEALTNADWGMGYDTGNMDDVRLKAAADVNFTEGFGISLTWAQQSSIEDFVLLVLRHVNGVLNQDRTTGKLFVKLVRYDYVPSGLIAINQTNAKLINYDRTGLGETVNEIALTYTTANGDEDTVVVQDLANITNQGQVISQSIDLPGLKNTTLAMRVAQRELNSRCAPVSKIQLTCNRIGFQLYEGDVFKFSWPDQGIVEAYYRIITMDLGTAEDSEITIDAVEDVFGLPNASYAKPEAGGWINPISAPVVSPLRTITETTYYDLARGLAAPDLAEIDTTDCFIDVYAKRPSSASYDYKLWTSVAPANPEFRNSAPHTPVANLSVALVKEEFSTVVVDSLSVLAGVDPEINDLIMIDGELMRIDTLNTSANSIGVARGVIDTVPQTHAVNAAVYFVSAGVGRDKITYLPSDVVRVKVQTTNPQGELLIASAPLDTKTMTQRQGRPYAPGRFRINGVYPPAFINTSDITVTWASRNRLTQTASPVAQDIASISSEPGVSYKIKILGESATVVDLSTSSTTYSLSATNEKAVSGVFDRASGRDLRMVGLGKVVSTVANNLTFDMQKVLSGWMRVQTGTVASGQSARYVDGTTGAITNREFSPSWLTTNTYDMFPLNPSVYQSYISNDTYNGWTVKRAVSNPSTDNTPISLLTPFDQVRGTVKDRRKTAASQIMLVDSFATLQYWVTTASAQRYISRRQYALHRVKRADVVTGPLVSTRTTLYDIYIGDLAQFDNPNFSSNAASPLNINGIIPNLCVIFGNLLYVYADRVTASTNTAGKAVNITNAITSHIDIATTVTAATYRFTIDTDGNLTPLTTRSGYYLADQVTATQGVEINGSSVVLVDMTTGALGSTIATLPGSTTAIQVVGDSVNSTFFVLAANLNIYKYSIAGTLLATIGYSSGYNNTTVQFFVTSGFLYLVGTNGFMLRYAKDLSGFSSFEISKLLNYNPDTVYLTRVAAYPDETQFMAISLLDESAAATTIVDAPTPRLNDTLTIELSSSREGLDSHTKHTSVVKRYGMGLRMGEYMG